MRKVLAANEIGTIRIASTTLRTTDGWRTRFMYSKPSASSVNSEFRPAQASATSSW